MSLPILRIEKGKDKQVREGNPWLFAGDIIASSSLALLEPGELVEVQTARGERIGIGYYNKHAELACRIVSLRDEAIDTAFFEHKIRAAIKRKSALAATRYFRVLHAEADSVPGLVVDQFDTLLSVQIGTAGMARLWPTIKSALENVLAPKGVILRSDAPKHEQVWQILHAAK